MDLKTFDFTKITGFNTNKELLAEAKERKFYCGRTPYNKLFSTLFFIGGRVQFKPDVDKEFINRAWPYCCAFMGSFAPSHEEKEAICAMIMSELLLPELDKS